MDWPTVSARRDYIRLEDHGDRIALDRNRELPEALADAGAGEAVPVLDPEESAVGGAEDHVLLAGEELVRHPVEGPLVWGQEFS